MTAVEDIVSENVLTIIVVIIQSALAVSAICVKDLTVVFGVIAAFSETFTNMIMPGLFLACSAMMVARMKARSEEDEYQRQVVDESAPLLQETDLTSKELPTCRQTCLGIIYAIFGATHCIYNIYQTSVKLHAAA